jgi:putative DNA methylase
MNDSPAPPRKKLIEHSLPLDAINAANRTKNKAPKGYVTKLHTYWAHRPLSCCRAILFAQLVDDPSAWPERFPTEEERERERRRLHAVIEAMVEWPKSDVADQTRFEKAIESARWEIARSVAWGRNEEPPAANRPGDVLEYLQTKAPSVYDPFCGGGSIPLEAQRLGLRAHGSDLNPLAVLITKALIEFPPRFAGKSPICPEAQSDLRNWRGAQGLAEDVRRYGEWVHDEAKKRIGEHYPTVELEDGSQALVTAWLWARTVASPDPAQKGAHVPLASTFVLSSKKDKEVIVATIKDSTAQDGWRFDVKSHAVSPADLAKAKTGTKPSRGANFICSLSGAPIDEEYVKAEGKAGRFRFRLMAIVAEGRTGRIYLSPSGDHGRAADVAAPDIAGLQQSMPENPRWFSPPDYGMPQYRDLFTQRQVLALATVAELVREARLRVLADAVASKQFAGVQDDRGLSAGGQGALAYADAVAVYLYCAFSRLAENQSTLVTWRSKDNALRSVFGRQALPMTWDFAEANPFAKSGGAISSAISSAVEALDYLDTSSQAHVSAIDAPQNSYPQRDTIISTDPPYYDNIGYADLSDYFFIWMRLILRDVVPELTRRVATPKDGELVAIPYRFTDSRYQPGAVQKYPEYAVDWDRMTSSERAEGFFMAGMRGALEAMRAAAADDIPLAIYYAFKQEEAGAEGAMSPGWAAFLQAVSDSGLQVDGTWPVRTEASNRSVGTNANALASSVVLVCRKRLATAPAIGRREFLRELRPVMAEAIISHQKAGIPLPDRRQAAIGPGIGVFSRYSMVREADDTPMRVSTALGLINQEIDALLAEGTEELDPETRFALQWYQLFGYKEMSKGQHDVISQLQAFNLSEGRINASGLFRAKAGSAKLLTREEMHTSTMDRYGHAWRASLDNAFTVWELAQHMARSLRAADGGVDAAGYLLAEKRECGSDVLLVAERLFALATTRKENDEALIWNELQTSWPHIESAADRAREAGVGAAPEQAELDI